MERSDPMDRQQCSATARTGERCKNTAIEGGTVCRMHGGAAPQVEKVAARRVLDSYLGPALTIYRDMLEQAMQNPDSMNDRDKITLFKDALDRAGFKAPTQVEFVTDEMLLAEKARREAEAAE